MSDKIQFNEVRREDINSLVCEFIETIENKFQIPAEKRDYFENDFCDKVDDILNDLFDHPDYSNYN